MGEGINNIKDFLIKFYGNVFIIVEVFYKDIYVNININELNRVIL